MKGREDVVGERVDADSLVRMRERMLGERVDVQESPLNPRQRVL